LDIVDRLVIGLKFLNTAASSPGFFRRGVTQPIFIVYGKTPVAKEKFAKCATGTDIVDMHCFRTEVGMMSSGDVFEDDL